MSTPPTQEPDAVRLLLGIGGIVLVMVMLALLAQLVSTLMRNREETRALSIGQHLGIAFTRGSGLPGCTADRPCASGNLGGWWVAWSARVGRYSSETWRVLFPAPSPVDFVLGLEPVGWGSGLLKSLAGDLEIGVPEFDDSFQIVCENPQWILRVLTPELRRVLVLHRDLFRGRNLAIRGTVIESTRGGYEQDLSRQQLVVRLLLTVATHVANASPAPRAI